MRTKLLCAASLLAYLAAPASSAPADQSPAPKPPCTGGQVLDFTVDSSGGINAKGRSVEGPACIQVRFNPLQFRVSIATVETIAAGPDLRSAILGAAGQGGTGEDTSKRAVAAASLPSMFSFLEDQFTTGARPLVRRLPGLYNAVFEAQTSAIAGIRTLLATTTGVDASTPALAQTITNYFNGGLSGLLNRAKSQQGNFLPADKSITADPSVLSALQKIRDDLLDLPIKFSTEWTEWYKDPGHKDAYDKLLKQLEDAIASAQLYATLSDNVKALQAKASIVNYWIGLFTGLGFTVGSTNAQPEQLASLGLVAHRQSCGALFNQSSSTAVSLVTVDQTPTLDGDKPAVTKQDAFMTVTCGSRFSVSGGFGFSTIRQREFAIVKSAGGANNTSVNKFDTLNDSRLHPLPMALVHARLGETANHRLGVHATTGIAGNIQGQSSGGSSAEFLLGLSVSFLRTIYLSGGLHIGTKPELAGGFNLGDAVPTDITTIQGQVRRSYTTGFGFAISFTKP